MTTPNTPRIVTKSMMVRDLVFLGVSSGQVLMLHASVKAIGWIVGGPDVVLDALLEALGPDGTLMMYVGWEDNTYHMVTWPEERQEAYLAECPAFDPSTSRARRDFSILTEYIRTREDAHRSANPEWSIVAIGPQARWLTEDHPLQYGSGPSSPFEKLISARGKVILLGSPLSNVTLLHYSEHLARVADKRVVHYRMPLIRDGHRVWQEFEELDSSGGIVEWPGDDYFLAIMNAYLATDRARVGQVGAATSYLIEAADLNSFAVEWMDREFNS